MKSRGSELYEQILQKSKEKLTIQNPSQWRQSLHVPLGIFVNKKKVKGVERTILHGGYYDGSISLQRTFL